MSGKIEKDPSARSVLAFEDEKDQRFYDYWRSLKQGPAAPNWSDFDLIEIRECLLNLVCLDCRSPREIIVLYQGTELVRPFGGDATGMNLFDLFDPAAAQEASVTSAEVLSGPYIRTATILMGTRLQETIRTTYLQLPARGRDGETSILLTNIHTQFLYAPLDSGAMLEVGGRRLVDERFIPIDQD
jgi:hypothetical protein